MIESGRLGSRMYMEGVMAICRVRECTYRVPELHEGRQIVELSK